MKIIMMGTGPFAIPTFEALLDSQHTVPLLVTRPAPASSGRRRSKVPPNPMREVAESRGIPVWDPVSINTDDAITNLNEQEADLFVVCDYGQILKRETLAAAPLGGINLHGSLLPKYRGAAPVNWAIYHGDAETGVTVIHMTPKLDGGPCLAARTTPISADDDAVTLESRLSQLGVQPVLDAIAILADWDRNSAIGTIQDKSLATKAPRLTKQDGAVDWHRSAAQIVRQIQAFKPWPKTYSHLAKSDGEPLRMIFDRAVVVDDETSAARSDVPTIDDAVPGQVVYFDAHTLHIQTGDGRLSLLNVQPSGKRVMDVSEFLRGHPMSGSARFLAPT